MRELQSAISIRKDVLIKREMAALAKFRKVPISEICRDELERKELKNQNTDFEQLGNKESAETSSICTKESRKLPTLSRYVLGKLPDASDLKEILCQRKNFTFVNSGGENFGDSEDEVE